ncbi:MAG: malonyl CoA-acyl carrier protein transacylase [Clostridiaceae bacterium]|jgi:[acyl-carrier-protein] S-malonyltransferase|nr:malonyl CoA-acyl carrier protein transacylase [Clostridiaceae bacterium]
MNKIALIMPGQGSQYIGMGKDLCSKYKIADEVFNEANNVLGFDLKSLCIDGNIGELTRTENTQPAILTASVAAFKVYMQEIGAKPICSAGHSLGELSALTCSGTINFSDALKIARSRGKFMQEAVEQSGGSMAAIGGISKYIIEDVCSEISTGEKVVVISNYNSKDQIVISGHKEAVSMAAEKLNNLNGKVTLMKVSGPFHSPLMQPAADKFKIELEKYKFNELDWDVISNINSRPYTDEKSIINNLTKQIVQPVQWGNTMEYLRGIGITDVIELGPGNVLKKLMEKDQSSINAYSFDKVVDVELVKKKFQDSKELKRKKYSFISRSLGIAVCTQNYNWNDEEYKKGVVEPYKKIKLVQDTIESEGKEPTIEQMREALEMLKSVFETKKTPIDEQIYRYNELFEETDTSELFVDYKMPL